MTEWIYVSVTLLLSIFSGKYWRIAPFASSVTYPASIPVETELLKAIRSADLTALAREGAVIFSLHCGVGIDATHKQFTREYRMAARWPEHHQNWHQVRRRY